MFQNINKALKNDDVKKVLKFCLYMTMCANNFLPIVYLLHPCLAGDNSHSRWRVGPKVDKGGPAQK